LHPNLPYGGPGLVARGSFLLREFTCETYASHNPTVTNQVKFRRARADMEAPGFSITNAIDGNTEKGGWTAATVPVRRNAEHRAVFECAEPIAGFPGGTRLHIAIYQKHSSGDGHSGELDKETKLDCHTLGCFRLSATTRGAEKWAAHATRLAGTAPRGVEGSSSATPSAAGEGAPVLDEFTGFGLNVDPLSAGQREILSIPPGNRTPGQVRELFAVFHYQDAAFGELNAEIDKVLTNWPYASTTLALQQRAVPREARIFKRGDWQRPGENVEPDAPAVLHPFPKDAPRNRLGLARWLVDRR